MTSFANSGGSKENNRMSEHLQSPPDTSELRLEPVELTKFYDESLVEDSPDPTPPARQRGLLWGMFAALFRAIRFVYRLIGAVLVLAVVAAVPIVNFWVLGYLLDAQGRVARGRVAGGGGWRDAFPDIASLSRIASIGVGISLCLLPLRLLAGLAADARLISAGSTADVGLHRAVIVAAVLVAVHIYLALARGGGLSCFFRPLKNLRWLRKQIRNGQYLEVADRETRAFIASLRIRERWWLGLRGFLTGLAWLIVPTAMFAAANSSEGGLVAVTIAGGLLLIPVLSWMPLLQARFAAERRWRAAFELRTVRRIFRRAPIAGTLAVIGTLVLSLPLYLAKVVLPPRDAMWMVTIVFIVSIWPVKLLSGWAYQRGMKRETDAWWGLRWLGRGVMLPLLAVYVFLLLFTPSLGEHGKWVLFEHHGFLLPVPF
ncbi:hypothetical protein Mal52_11910 [Symmachiella dynata]|uniref:DUF4013 domain-containing protein n=2 Tax=Symmachiella dynata TaxID=2527995 RepID=A0A517ZJS6_9PLAN|nr:hypothetical protein Mal52_11910 [Symmachiella dynata]